MYTDAARPTCASVIARPLPGSVMRDPIAPTIVTSRPSRIHTLPRPARISQCQRAQGRRARRAGMSVVTLLITHAPDRGSVTQSRFGGGLDEAGQLLDGRASGSGGGNGEETAKPRKKGWMRRGRG